MPLSKMTALLTLAGITMLANGSPAEDADATRIAPATQFPSVFKITDTNGDGKITTAEFQTYQDTWFKEIDTDRNGKMTMDELVKNQQDQFKALDSNHDSSAIMEEYLNFFGGPTDEIDRQIDLTKSPAPTLFATMDTNADGNITAAEFTAYRVVIFRQVDANGDGKITPEEFALGTSNRFTAMDANKDNFVTKEEFDVTGLATARKARLPDRLDTN